MNYYSFNPRCGCARCRARGLMGPAVLVTLGVLFLIGELAGDWRFGFNRTWPILLIVIGLVKVMQHNAPTDSHQPLGYVAPPVPPAFVTPPPVQASSLPGQSDEGSYKGDR